MNYATSANVQATPTEPGITSRIKNLKEAMTECHGQISNIESCLQEAGLFFPEPKSMSPEPAPSNGLEGHLQDLGRAIANMQMRLNEVNGSVVKLTR